MIGRAWRAFARACRAETRGWGTGARIIAEEQAIALTRETWDKTPVPPLTRGGTGTTPGLTPDEVRSLTRAALSPAPGSGLYGRCVMTIHLFDTGISVAYNHQRMTRSINIPPVDEWDAP